MLEASVIVLAAYVIGSISFAQIAGKLNGVNLREHGSGNLGATNVGRVCGKYWGIAVLILDCLKGFVPTYFAMQYFQSPWWHVAVGAVVIIGHSLSVFANFKGGKGVASALGMLIALNPSVAGVILGIVICVIAITKYVSLGSIIGCILMPIGFYYVKAPMAYLVVVSIMGVFIIWRHRSNVVRLLQGKENKLNG